MADLPDPQRAAQEARQRVEAELREVDPAPFSVAAFALLTNKLTEYLRELVAESIKVANRHQADTVSAAHVERAVEYLVSSTSRRFFRHLGTLGGIVLGAALSNILAMVTSGQYSAVGVLVSAGLAVVGSFVIALHIAKD